MFESTSTSASNQSMFMCPCCGASSSIKAIVSDKLQPKDLKIQKHKVEVKRKQLLDDLKKNSDECERLAKFADRAAIELEKRINNAKEVCDNIRLVLSDYKSAACAYKAILNRDRNYFNAQKQAELDAKIAFEYEVKNIELTILRAIERWERRIRENFLKYLGNCQSIMDNCDDRLNAFKSDGGKANQILRTAHLTLKAAIDARNAVAPVAPVDASLQHLTTAAFSDFLSNSTATHDTLQAAVGITMLAELIPTRKRKNITN